MPSSRLSAVDRDRLRRLQSPEHVDERTCVALTLLWCAVVLLAVVAWNARIHNLTVSAWLAIAWLNHSALAMLHESVHGLLSRSRFRNEATGFVIGLLSLTPMSVYRYVHARHHAHLGRERDPEFWPYNLPGSSRALRIGFAWSELAFGWLLTPLLYSLRTAAAWSNMRRALRRRLVFEWLSLLAFWSSIVGVVAWTRRWDLLLVGYVVPAWLTGCVQTVRKFTEHLGRHGDTIASLTRTVRYRGPIGRLLSLSQLHVELHATHHRCPRIPWRALPQATEILSEGTAVRSSCDFANHIAAIRDVIGHLGDPRVGPQWRSDIPEGHR